MEYINDHKFLSLIANAPVETLVPINEESEELDQ